MRTIFFLVILGRLQVCTDRDLRYRENYIIDVEKSPPSSNPVALKMNCRHDVLSPFSRLIYP